MRTAYQLRVYDPVSGTVQAVSGLQTDIRTVNITHRVNHPSTVTIGMYGLSNLVQYFVLDSIVEVRRRVPDAGVNWYTEYIGLHRTPQRQITTSDNRIFTAYGRGLLDLIRRRSIRYYAETDGSDKGPAPADDVIKAFVRENAGSLATTGNNRITDGQISGLLIAPDQSEAASYSGAHAWQNLLDTIQKIGEPNKVDFDVTWGGEADPLGFTFNTHYPQLGTDRREGTANPMVFAPELGNMADPSLTHSRTEEVTSALVLGPGQSTLRDTTLRTSLHTVDSPWNLIEQDIDAASEETVAALEGVGDRLLYDKRPAISFNFTPIQTEQSCYGKHYFLGDLVTGRFDNISADVKIRAVSITIDESSREVVTLELEEIPA